MPDRPILIGCEFQNLDPAQDAAIRPLSPVLREEGGRIERDPGAVGTEGDEFRLEFAQARILVEEPSRGHARSFPWGLRGNGRPLV